MHYRVCVSVLETFITRVCGNALLTWCIIVSYKCSHPLTPVYYSSRVLGDRFLWQWSFSVFGPCRFKRTTTLLDMLDDLTRFICIMCVCVYTPNILHLRTYWSYTNVSACTTTNLVAVYRTYGAGVVGCPARSTEIELPTYCCWEKHFFLVSTWS